MDIDYINEMVDGLYYLIGIADQSSNSGVLEYYQQPKYYVHNRPRKNNTIESKEDSIKQKDEVKKPIEIIKIVDMPRGARYIFENNPFCVLGISSNSSRADALKVRDKLQKLNNLGAADSYISAFDFDNIEKPNRDLGRLQVVLENINDLSHRWLWLREASHYTSAWNIFTTYNSEGVAFNYNRMIVVYLCLLLSDSEITSKYCWNSLLTIIDELYKLDDYELYNRVKESLPVSDLEKYNFRMIASSFRESILMPLLMNIEGAQGSGLLAMHNYFKGTNYAFTQTLLTKITESSFEWAYNRINIVKNVMSTIEGNSLTSNINAIVVESVLDTYFDKEFDIVQDIANALMGVELYTERINDKLKSVVWDATNILAEGGKKAKACKYDCLIYFFCNEREQNQIKRFYPYEMQSLPDSAYTIEECKKAATSFDEKNDKENYFIWLLKAAEKGDSDSQNSVGVAYALGRGVTKSEAKAIEWYEKSARQGNGYALSNMASRYYNGSFPCRKNVAKAKDYWIRAVVALRRQDDINHLNEKFPGWQTSDHPSLSFGEKDWEYKLRPMAEIGIPSAEHWYGHHLYVGKYGCKRDEKASRRWLLLASAHGYSLSKINLDIWFDINTEEANTPRDMFSCGVKYSKLSGEQNEDLTFYWYYRAYHAGYTSGANNLGVCYDNGNGTKRDYEMANKLYLVGISHDNAGSCYNYGYNLYFGHGVDKDIDKARQHMMKAAELGNNSAKEFLKEHFGITHTKYKEFEPFWFTRREGVSLSFDKLEVVPEGIKLTFWVKNTNQTSRTVWMEYNTVNGVRQENWKKLIEIGSEQNEFFSFVIEAKSIVNNITLGLEVDQNGTSKVFSYPEFSISINNKTGEIIPSILNITEDSDEREEFEDIEFAIYDKNDLHIEFCYFEIDDDDDVYMTFWVNNKTKEDYRFWAMDVNIDGDHEANLEIIGVVNAGTSNWCKLQLNNMSPDGCYNVDCYIEIDNLDNEEIDCTPRISVNVDFDDFTQSARIIKEKKEDIEFDDISFDVYDKDNVYVEFCNFEIDNDEAYFSFWIKNDTNQIINVYAQDVFVDGCCVADYKHIGEFKPYQHTYGRFTLPQVKPDGSYSIKTYIEIDDDDCAFIDSGEEFNIEVDFDDGLLSADFE